MHGDGILVKLYKGLCFSYQFLSQTVSFAVNDRFIFFHKYGLQDEKAQTETTNQSLVQENQMLLQQIDDLREKFEKLHKEHEELEVKSKAELKVLVKEVKSLRTTQSELKQELSRTMKEKLEMEVIRSLQEIYSSG